VASLLPSRLEVKGVAGELGPTVEVASATIRVDRAPTGTSPSVPVISALDVSFGGLDTFAVHLFAMCLAGTPATVTLSSSIPLGVADVRQLVLTGATVTAVEIGFHDDAIAYQATVTGQTHTWLDKVVTNGSVSGALSITYDDVAKKVV
jgi:hypothetical protein